MEVATSSKRIVSVEPTPKQTLRPKVQPTPKRMDTDDEEDNNDDEENKYSESDIEPHPADVKRAIREKGGTCEDG